MKSFLLLVMVTLIFTMSIWADDLIINGNFSAATPTTGGIYGWMTSTALTGTTSAGAKVSFLLGDPLPCASVGNTWDAQYQSTDPWMGTISLQQNIVVPRDALGSTLVVNYRWDQDGVTSPYDWVQCSISNSSIPLFNPTPVDNSGYEIQGSPTPTPGWNQASQYVPLQNLQGQVLTILFSANSSVSAPSLNCLSIDNVSLPCITATKTATPLPTFTSTITLTVTPTPTITQTFTITPTATITPTLTNTITQTPWTAKKGEMAVYPNPASGSKVNFMYSLENAANVKIDVYNLAGQKVAHLEDANKPGLANQITTWNIENVAPGIYLYRLTLEDISHGTSTTEKFKKLVITK